MKHNLTVVKINKVLIIGLLSFLFVPTVFASAPPKIIDLTLGDYGNGCGFLNWTNPASGGVTQLMTYDIRYRINSPITALNWASSQIATSTFIINDAISTLEYFYPLPMATSSVTYYFALKATNDLTQISVMSNAQSVVTPSDWVSTCIVNSWSGPVFSTSTSTTTQTIEQENFYNTATVVLFGIVYLIGGRFGYKLIRRKY